MKSLLLHGYGLSIKVKNTRLIFSEGIDPFPAGTKETELLLQFLNPCQKITR